MATNAKTTALEEWVRSNGGYLHPNVFVAHDEASGYHLRARSCIDPEVEIVRIPHSLALSYITALVDDTVPVFRHHKHRFKVEAIGFFYLMVQYVYRDLSFWKPYLDTLPGPEAEHLQPLWFESPEDITWLEGTDVWHTITARKAVYEEYYQDGVDILREAGFDVAPYTWRLFKWAATISSSRSFSSRTILPDDITCWTAYKSANSEMGGRRVPVSLDMCDVSVEDLNFPVLFPGLDVANHNPDAPVMLNFGPSQLTVTMKNVLTHGEEFFINYGPKGNDELLLGYGFCFPNNPHDRVWLTLKEPPPELQWQLKEYLPQYFDGNGIWDLKESTFLIGKHDPVRDDTLAAFRNLPESLVKLLLCILRHERNLPFEIDQQPLERLLSQHTQDARFLPHIARMLVQSLAQKLSKLGSIDIQAPRDARQQHAATYRKSQINILESNIAALRAYTRGLIWRPDPKKSTLPEGPFFVRLEDLLSVLTNAGVLDQAFLDGIKVNANTVDIATLRAAGWEEDIWVLVLCYIALQGDNAQAEAWKKRIFPRYIMVSSALNSAPDASFDNGNGIMDIVRAAAVAYPSSLWSSSLWNTNLIRTMGQIVAMESFVTIYPSSPAPITDGGEDQKPCICILAGP